MIVGSGALVGRYFIGEKSRTSNSNSDCFSFGIRRKKHEIELTMHRILFVVMLGFVGRCLSSAAEPIELPPDIQRNLNEQRRYGLAGLTGFTVGGAIGATTQQISAESREEVRQRLVDRVIRELRSNELLARTDKEYDAEIDRTGADRNRVNARTGVISCSVEWVKTSDSGLARIIVFDVAAWMTNPRTGRTGMMSVWTHVETRAVKDPSASEIFVFSNAIQKFVIDYVQAQR